VDIVYYENLVILTQ